MSQQDPEEYIFRSKLPLRPARVLNAICLGATGTTASGQHVSLWAAGPGNWGVWLGRYDSAHTHPCKGGCSQAMEIAAARTLFTLLPQGQRARVIVSAGVAKTLNRWRNAGPNMLTMPGWHKTHIDPWELPVFATKLSMLPLGVLTVEEYNPQDPEHAALQRPAQEMLDAAREACTGVLRSRQSISVAASNELRDTLTRLARNLPEG